MTDYTALAREHARRWAAMHVNDGRRPVFDSVAKRLIAPEARGRYRDISKRTGVPWWVIAVIHEREASQRWDRNIAQGDPFRFKSVNVPAGRGPFKSFEDAAYDALVNCAPYAARNKDWSIGATLVMLERYNGMGYAGKGVPSPYIWAGTDQYKSGKYIRDHVYDPTAVDKQLGCAGLLARMAALDSSIVLTGTPKVDATPALPTPAPKERTSGQPTPPSTPSKAPHAGAVVVVGGAAAAAASGHHWVAIALIAALAVAGGAYLLYRKFKK
jgi:lysozyme family protein